MRLQTAQSIPEREKSCFRTDITICKFNYLGNYIHQSSFTYKEAAFQLAANKNANLQASKSIHKAYKSQLNWKHKITNTKKNQDKVQSCCLLWDPVSVHGMARSISSWVMTGVKLVAVLLLYHVITVMANPPPPTDSFTISTMWRHSAIKAQFLETLQIISCLHQQHSASSLLLTTTWEMSEYLLRKNPSFSSQIPNHTDACLASSASHLFPQ